MIILTNNDNMDHRQNHNTHSHHHISSRQISFHIFSQHDVAPSALPPILLVFPRLYSPYLALQPAAQRVVAGHLQH